MGSPLFDRARDALRRHDAAAADELDAAWKRRPWVVAIAGDDQRAEVVSAAIGARIANVAAVRVRRGERSRFRAVRQDGTIEEHSLKADEIDRERLVVSVREAKEELGQRTSAIEKVGSSVPIVVRRKPQWWQLWLWPLWFVFSWLYRRRLVEVERAVGAGDDARRGVEAAELELATTDAKARDARVRYAESLRAVAGGGDVKQIEIEVEDGPLAPGVELVVSGDADVTLPAREVGAALGRLDQVAARAREVALVRRAREAITAAAAALNERLAHAEEGFRARFAKLEAMRIEDSDGFVGAVKARVRPQIVGGVHAVIEHAGVHLGTELAALQQEWIESIAAAGDGDGLSAVLERIEVSAPNVTQRIADEVRLLVGNGVAGVVHDLWPALVASLKPHGLPEPARTKTEIAQVELLPSLGGSAAKLGGRLKRLTGLFKGFDSKRTDARENAHARLEHLKEVANAELLDAEPRLHEAIAAAVGAELAGLLGLQAAWLDRAIIAERDAVGKEREGLAAIAAERDAAFREADALADELARTAA